MSKTIPDEEVTVWFNVHNMNYEKIELFGDIFKSLNQTIVDTYMGESDGETKISLTQEDKENHFEWCWNTVIKNFKKEEVSIKANGEHKEYFKQFFLDSFYNQSQENDTTKFFKGNKSAGTRARKTAQDLKALLQKLRGEILEHKKTETNA